MGHLTTLSTARSGHNFVVNNIISWIERNDGNRVLHHNLENIDPARIVPNHLKFGGPRVLIWRDFDDWLASIIMKAYKTRPTRRWEDVPEYIDRVCKIYWLQQEERKHPKYFNADANIHYDEFVRSREYRESVCDILGGRYNEKMIEHVATQNNGSSFDGITLQGRGSKMGVLKRRSQILNTPHKEFYLRVLQQYENG